MAISYACLCLERMLHLIVLATRNYLLWAQDLYINLWSSPINYKTSIIRSMRAGTEGSHSLSYFNAVNGSIQTWLDSEGTTEGNLSIQCGHCMNKPSAGDCPYIGICHTIGYPVVWMMDISTNLIVCGFYILSIKIRPILIEDPYTAQAEMGHPRNPFNPWNTCILHTCLPHFPPILTHCHCRPISWSRGTLLILAKTHWGLWCASIWWLEKPCFPTCHYQAKQRLHHRKYEACPCSSHLLSSWRGSHTRSSLSTAFRIP